MMPYPQAVLCRYCRAPMSRRSIDAHERSCPSRPRKAAPSPGMLSSELNKDRTAREDHRFVPRVCAACGRAGGTVAFVVQRTVDGELRDVRDYYHPRCIHQLLHMDGDK